MFDQQVAVIFSRFTLQLVISISEIRDFGKVQGNAGKPSALASGMNDVLGKRAILGQIWRADTGLLVASKIGPARRFGFGCIQEGNLNFRASWIAGE